MESGHKHTDSQPSIQKQGWIAETVWGIPIFRLIQIVLAILGLLFQLGAELQIAQLIVYLILIVYLAVVIALFKANHHDCHALGSTLFELAALTALIICTIISISKKDSNGFVICTIIINILLGAILSITIWKNGRRLC